MGDLNIDMSDKRKDNNNFLSDLCGTFSMQNIVTGKTCRKSNAGTSVDIMLTINQEVFTRLAYLKLELSIIIN